MENIINSDPTLKAIISYEIDYKMFDWHVELKCIALKIALRKYIESYPLYN